MPRAKQSTAVAKWDEELAKQAQVAAGMEAGTGTGQFFSLKAGMLSFAGAPFPNNEMACVILDSVLENVHYSGKFVEGAPTAPSCFAFGRSLDEMAPHDVCSKAGSAISDVCSGCPQNEWGSADVGKGKACKNTRRLAMIPAGTFDNQGRLELIDDPVHYRDAEVAFMRLPVTSVKGYASFVNQLAAALKRPPHGVVTRIKVVQDATSQFKVTFTPIQALPDAVMADVMARHNEVVETIMFPYQAAAEQTPTKAQAGRAPARAQAAVPGRGRKY